MVVAPTKLVGPCPSGEMADATDSKSVFERSAGSSPASGTNLQGLQRVSLRR